MNISPIPVHGAFFAQKTLINTRKAHQNTLKNWHIFCISY